MKRHQLEWYVKVLLIWAGSTITLPSEELMQASHDGKKRRYSRLWGLPEAVLSAARRPTSTQVLHGKVASTSSGTRHASYGSSVGRATSKTFSYPSKSLEDLQPQEGSRGFMSSMRKISLVGGRSTNGRRVLRKSRLFHQFL